jgi:hypothetical protein
LEDSNYFLVGNAENKYAWVNLQALKWTSAKVSSLTLPAITKFVSPEEKDEKRLKLAELVQRLGRMHSWVTLKFFSPPITDASGRLELNPISKDGAIPEGSFLEINLTNPESKKFYYLVSFNRLDATMSFENEKENCPVDKKCTIEEVSTVAKDLENKILILLTTNKKIEYARGLFTKEGVKSLASDSLNLLLSQLQSGQQDKDLNQQPIIEKWSIDVLPLKVEAKKP